MTMTGSRLKEVQIALDESRKGGKGATDSTIAAG